MPIGNNAVPILALDRRPTGETTMSDAATLPEALAAILAQDITLAEALARYASDLARLSPAIAAAYQTLVERLDRVETGRTAPGVGDLLPDFILTDQDGRLRALRDFTATGPVIVSINRGHWCPFCRIELNALAKASQALASHGAGIVSIMPETQAFTKILRELGVSFPVLSDIDCSYSLDLGLCFYLGDDLVNLLRSRGHGMPVFQGNESWFLPVPATFVVGPDRRILARHVDPDFRQSRMAIEEILIALAQTPIT